MIHVVTGQTATGKTSYALQLATKLNGELVNADARQLYKELDIVTGKDLQHTTGLFQKVTELNGFDIGYYQTSPAPSGHPLLKGGPRLWLYDIASPNKPFSTYDYKELAQWVINDIESRGNVPIIVGGSYFYIQHLLYGVVDNEVPPNNELRQKLDGASVSELQDNLKQLNASLFEGLNNSEQHNPQRLIRRIEKEMYRFKHPPSDIRRRPPSQGGPSNDLPFEGSTRRGRDVEIQITGFQYEDKNQLQSVISDRVEKRIDAGAIDETKKLIHNGYTSKDPGLKTIGYTQIIQYLNKEISAEEMKAIWISKEVQYAKRQLTFMKKNDEIAWTFV